MQTQVVVYDDKMYVVGGYTYSIRRAVTGLDTNRFADDELCKPPKKNSCPEVVAKRPSRKIRRVCK